MPASAAVATFSFKNIQANLPPADVDVGFATSIKKKYGDVTLSLSFTDATLKSPSSGQGIVVTADKPVGGKENIEIESNYVELVPNPYFGLFHIIVPQTASRLPCPTTWANALEWQP